MTKITILPDDMIRTIYSYLLPETKIHILLQNYPNKYNTLKLLTVPNLKHFYKQIVYIRYSAIESYNYNDRPFRVGLMPDYNTILCNPRNKTEYIDEIDRLLQSFRNPRPISNEIYTFFQMRALRLLQSIIFVGNRLGKKKRKVK